MSTFKLMCVTSRALCKNDFLTQIEQIAAASPSEILLREKDLAEPDYMALAQKVLAVCRSYQVPCILHTYPGAASALHCPRIHLPLALLHEQAENLSSFQTIGASIHSVEEAKEAQRLGATYLTAGHIFATDCKKGVPPRGLLFLQKVCAAVTIPVYAIGGITPFHIKSVQQAGAAGACIMSGLMQSAAPVTLLSEFQCALTD